MYRMAINMKMASSKKSNLNSNSAQIHYNVVQSPKYNLIMTTTEKQNLDKMLDRAENYLKFADAHATVVALGIETALKPLYEKFEVPQDLWLPEVELTSEAKEEIIQLVTLIKAGKSSEDDVEAILHELEDFFDLDYTYILVGTPTATANQEAVQDLAIAYGSRSH